MAVRAAAGVTLEIVPHAQAVTVLLVEGELVLGIGAGEILEADAKQLFAAASSPRPAGLEAEVSAPVEFLPRHAVDRQKRCAATAGCPRLDELRAILKLPWLRATGVEERIAEATAQGCRASGAGGRYPRALCGRIVLECCRHRTKSTLAVNSHESRCGCVPEHPCERTGHSVAWPGQSGGHRTSSSICKSAPSRRSS